MQANPEKIDHVIIVGAGMAGLLAAASLSDVTKKVSLIDKDSIPDSPQFRPGVAQGAHVHTLLGYGVEAMEKLIPGLMSDLYSEGAVKIRRN
ncbi:MAG: NAD(P)-binding protein [Gammaproteobacteria bacterium]|nr:NAD(P)-binding protein [Gammaproteobacteria bacterium]